MRESMRASLKKLRVERANVCPNPKPKKRVSRDFLVPIASFRNRYAHMPPWLAGSKKREPADPNPQKAYLPRKNKNKTCIRPCSNRNSIRGKTACNSLPSFLGYVGNSLEPHEARSLHITTPQHLCDNPNIFTERSLQSLPALRHRERGSAIRQSSKTDVQADTDRQNKDKMNVRASWLDITHTAATLRRELNEGRRTPC